MTARLAWTAGDATRAVKPALLGQSARHLPIQRSPPWSLADRQAGNRASPARAGTATNLIEPLVARGRCQARSICDPENLASAPRAGPPHQRAISDAVPIGSDRRRSSIAPAPRPLVRPDRIDHERLLRSQIDGCGQRQAMLPEVLVARTACACVTASAARSAAATGTCASLWAGAITGFMPTGDRCTTLASMPPA